ncbi:MAG TPA: hypothetical protein VF981_00340 [Gemmatimonadaceae bacterium]
MSAGCSTCFLVLELVLSQSPAPVAFQVNSSMPGALGRGMSPARLAIEVAGIVADELSRR